MNTFLRKNNVLLITLAVILVLFITAAQGMDKQDFVITLMRGLAVGSITFLVASGFSLIFGLLDVLNLAHGTLFMIGAYIGWTIFVRPDTSVDLLTPLALTLSGFALRDVCPLLSSRIRLGFRMRRILPWILILASLLLFGFILPRYPIAIWNVENYGQSPVTFAFMASQGTRLPVSSATFTEISPTLAWIGLLLASMIGVFGLSIFERDTQRAMHLSWRNFVGLVLLLVIALFGFIFNDALTNFLLGLNSNWLFLI